MRILTTVENLQAAVKKSIFSKHRFNHLEDFNIIRFFPQQKKKTCPLLLLL